MSLRATCLAVGLVATAAGVAEEARPWSAGMSQEAGAWPHAERDARIAVTAQGLRVEIAERRKFGIAAASGLVLPRELGQVGVRGSKTGGGAKWFVRLYGEMRRAGERRTVTVAQDEAAAGERVFPLDSAALIVVAPAGSRLTRDGPRTLTDGVVVKWREPAADASIQSSQAYP